MQESIGDIISRGFEAWKRNPVLCLPFLIESLLVYAIALAATVPFTSPLQLSDIYEMTIGSREKLILQNEAAFGINLLAILIASIIAFPFFEAGAICMAQEAMDRGRTSLGTLWRSGMRYYFNLLATNIITGFIMLMTLAIAMLLINIMPFMGLPLTLFLTAALLIAAIMVILALLPAPYVLVIKGVGPVNAIKESIQFFRENQIEVMVIGSLLAVTSMITGLVDWIGLLDSEYIIIAASLLGAILQQVILPPLDTVWWTRLYMVRTGRLSEAKDA